MVTISVSIVTYNSCLTIQKCIESLLIQSIGVPEIIIVDNGSSDCTIDFIQRNYPFIKLHKNATNSGFASAQNQAIRDIQYDYILVLNPDVILKPNYLEEMLAAMEKDYSIGIVCGKLLRTPLSEESPKVIDSTGILIKKNRRAYDRGQGEVDQGQYDKPEFVFGACAAAALYRKSMLEDIKSQDDIFDESFFTYKEDVDLSWRAKLRGWKCFYTPKALAYHMRGWAPESRKKIPQDIQIHSYKNRYIMILKNDSFLNLFRHLPWILICEILIFFHNLVRTPYLFKAWPRIIRLITKSLLKRKQIQSNKKVSEYYMAKWFV